MEIIDSDCKSIIFSDPLCKDGNANDPLAGQ